MRRGLCAAALVAMTAGGASAQITPVGPFTGDMSENLDTIEYQSFPRTITGFFGGTVTANAIGGSQGLSITGGWFYFCGIFPLTGDRLFGSTSQVIVEWVFDNPVGAWGGYFGCNADVPDAFVRFYDESNSLIGEVTAAVPLCGIWTWNGWQSSVPIARIEVEAKHSLGGHIMHDDMELMFEGGGGCDCVCNYDTSTGADVCDFFDFINFQDLFASGDPCGCDLDTSTGSGVCDFFDFINFQDLFSVGC